MKNLFMYATKKLSQDAFLCWLFESYNDSELNDCVITLLSDFCDFKEKGKIYDIMTYKQKQKIDVVIGFKVNNQKYAVYIEDKTYSNEHNQLKKYNEIIEKSKKNEDIKKSFKIFYKTSMLSQKDESAVTEAGWKKYDIEKIFKLFKQYKNCHNIILKQYIEYLEILYEAENNKKKPNKSDSKIDQIKWKSYFNYVLKNIVDPKKYKKIVCDFARYNYCYFAVGTKEKMPYLEIRSRDCKDNKFNAKILCFGIEEDKFTPQEKVIEYIKNDSTVFKCNKLHSYNGKHPKTIGNYEISNIETDEQFVAEFKKCLEDYNKIVKLWK